MPLLCCWAASEYGKTDIDGMCSGNLQIQDGYVVIGASEFMNILAMLLLFEIDWFPLVVWGYSFAVIATFIWVVWYVVTKQD